MSMMKIAVVGNVVRDAVVKTGKDGPFTSFSVAIDRKIGGKKATIYPDVTLNGDGLAPYLLKGAQVLVVADDLIEVPYTNDKTGKSGTGHKLVGAQVKLGDAMYCVARGHMASALKPIEGKGVSAGTLLGNVKVGKEEVKVATSFLLGEKAADSAGQYFVKGKSLTLAGFGSIRSYLTKSGEAGAELKLGSADFALGPDPKGKDASAAPAAKSKKPAPAGDFDEDDIPL